MLVGKRSRPPARRFPAQASGALKPRRQIHLVGVGRSDQPPGVLLCRSSRVASGSVAASATAALTSVPARQQRWRQKQCQVVPA